MPNGIDNRIVQMQFDNRQFERNIKTSGKSLEKFKELLNFDSCEKSLNKFGKATEQLTFEKMSDNLQKLTNKFTGLGTASELVLSQIRRGIERTAASVSRFVDSMTLEQINAGFQKFGDLNKNVQTIMAATGRSEEEVYKVMQRLNEYTDQTSYSFIDMASNIGKFTSVGIGLEEAEKQMEGIANWAARSGGGVQEASRAMYNLSQAMGVGALTKIDWKSIENAGMATKEYKEQLIQAGLATGMLVKENGQVMTAKSLGKQIEVTYQNLAETLSKKWATTEVMQKSFMAYYYEDLYYTGEITSGVATTKEQRDEIRELLAKDKKIDAANWAKLELDSEESRQKLIDAAVEQKKLLKEVDEEGYTVYKTLGKGAKQVEITAQNFDKFIKEGLLDESLMTVVFGLDMDPLIESTEEQKQALKDALGEDDIILKKDWVEDLKAAGLATDQFKQAALDAAVSAGTLRKETDKAGNTVYKTAKGFGKEMVVNLENFDESLKNKWFTREVADRAVKLDNLGKAAYESAQKCMTFTDVLNAWKDQLSTGWMNSYNKIFGELSESMELFSNVCNKVGAALGELIEFRNAVLEAWGKGGRTNLWGLIIGDVIDEGESVAYEGVYGFLDVLGDIGEMISTAFWETMTLLADPGSRGQMNDANYRIAWMAGTLDYVVMEIQSFLNAIHDFFESSSEGSEKSRWQQVQDVVNAIFATFVLAESVIRDVSNGLAILFDQNHLGPSVDALLVLFSELGLTISNAAKDAQDGHGLLYLLQQLDVTCRPLILAINELIGAFVELAVEFLRSGREDGGFLALWQSVADGINNVAGIITKYGTPIIHFLATFVGILGRLLQNGINTEGLITAGQEIKTALKTMLDTIFSGIPNFSERASAFWTTVTTWVTNGFQQADWESVKAKLKSAIDIVLGVLPEGWGDSIKSVYQKIKTSIAQFVDKVKEFFISIKEAFQNNFNEQSLTNIATKAKALWSTIITTIPEGISSVIGPAYTAVVDYVKNLWTRITGFFNSLFGGEDSPVNTVVTSLLPGAESNKALEKAKQDNIFEKVVTWLETSATNLKTSFQKLLGNDAGDAGSFGEAIKQLEWGKIMTVMLAALGGVGIITVIAKVIGIVKALAGALDTITELMEKGIKIGPEAKKADIGDKMLKIAGSIAILAASITVIANLKADSAWRALEIIGIVSALLMLMVGISQMMAKNTSVGEAASSAISFIGIAIAIGRVIAALMPLKDVTSDQFRIMMDGLFDIMLALGGLAAAAKYLDLSFKNTAGVLAFCAGVWLIIDSLLKIKDLEPIQLIKMFGSLFVILGLLVAFAWALKKVGGSLAGSGMKEAAFLALAVGILVRSLLPLAKYDLGQIFTMLIGLAGILALLAGFTYLIGKIGNGGLTGSGMVQLLAVAGSIMMLMLALLPLALLNDKQFARIQQGLLDLMLALMAFIGFTNVFAKGGLTGSGMTQLIAVAGSIMMLMLALLPLALLNDEQFARMQHGLLDLMLALMAFIGFVNVFAKGGLAGSGMTQLLALAGAMALVVLALIPIALMDENQVGQMMAAFLSIMIMFSVIIAAAKKLDSKSALGAMGMMVMLSVMMYSFAMALTLIPSNMNWQTIMAFAVGLSAMILAVGGAFKLSSGLDPKSAVVAVVAIAAAIAAIVGVIALMAPMVVNRIGSSIEHMAAQFSLIGGMLGEFMGYMNSIKESDIDAAKRKFDKLYQIIVSLKDVGGYLPVIHKFAECCLLLGSGLHQFELSTIGIGDPSSNNGILLLEKLLSYQDKLSNFTGAAHAADQMNALGGGLSSFNAGANGITTSETVAFQMLSRLLSYGDSFSNLNGAFGASLQMASLGGGLSTFNSTTSGITDANPAALQLITNMANNADALDKLTKINLAGFSDQMAGLGGALGIYALGVKESAGIEIGDMPDVSGAIAILTSLTQGLSNDIGELAIPEMPEETKLEHFGVQLAALAGGLIKFSEASQGLGDYSKALEVLTFMKGLKQDLTLENVKVTGVFSEAGLYDFTIEAFGNSIAALGGSLKSYNDSVTDFTKNQAALDVLDFMVELKGKLGDKSNLEVVKAFSEAGIYGDTTITNFGTQISALGNSMKAYNDSVKNFKENKDAVKALEFFRDLKTHLTDELISRETFEVFKNNGIDESTLTSFGTDIAALGEALAGFASNVNFSKETGKKLDFNNAIDALKTIKQLANELPKYGGWADLIHGETLKLSALAEDIKVLGTSLAQFSDNLSAVGQNSGKTYNIDLVKGALESVQMITNMVLEMSKVDNFAALTSYAYADTLTEIVRSMQEVPDFADYDQHGAFIDSVVAFMKRFENAAKEVGGINDATLFTSFANLASGIQTLAATSPAFDFKPIGLNIAAGIESGIVEGSSSVITSAVNLAVMTYDAVCKSLGIESPSRAFMRIGSYISEGMAIGISQTSSEAAKASESMASNTLNSARSILANVSSILAEDVDAQPTIRPVLDLSNVTAGARTIGGIFGDTYGIGLDTRGITSRAARTYTPVPVAAVNQNGMDSSALSRMDAMVASMQQMSDSISNMKLVLDTGAVAGGVSDDVDINIGRKMFYAGRRN